MTTRTINFDEGNKRISIIMSFDEAMTPTIVSHTVMDKEEYLRGLGDVIAKATAAIGIKPCAGCKERQEALNKLVPFENKDTNGNQ